jgi:phospholipid/cholesterol/gamma-HCH transport system substrate-binding protein
MSKELKLGILGAISIFAAVWGYTYIKGNDLFSSTKTFYTTYDDVTGLAPSNPVLVNGYKIGTVSKIVINPKNVKKMDVYFTIIGDYELPKDTKVGLVTESIVGGKMLTLSYDKPCSTDCAKDGDFLNGQVIGLLTSMLGTDDLNSYIKTFSTETKTLVDGLGQEGAPGALNSSIRQIDQVLANLGQLTANINNLLKASYSNINATTDNINKLSLTLAKSDKEISKIIGNLSTTSTNLSAINLASMADTTTLAISEAKQTMEALQASLTDIKTTTQEFNSLFGKLNSGNGSAAMLLNDKTLYNNFNKTVEQTNLLLQDLRLNPKRYINIALINKSKPYVYPILDPADTVKVKN